MIPQIKELNFPTYATLSQATVTLNDMGDKTISTQVKIDGSIRPDFSYDWEIEFRDERYIHPLRVPQASKSNESIQSVIDIVFHHWATYQLKRHFFTQIEVLESGTLMPNNYVYTIGLSLSDFIAELANNLEYYYKGKIKVSLNDNPKTPYSEDKVEWSLNYTNIWDALLQLNEKHDVRWQWAYDKDSDVYTIEVGYDAVEVTHIFEYGYEKGLTKIERQVQDAEIRNQMFGRGGAQNLPYRYFKNIDPNNPEWKADPDWIPELENIYFSELRGKTFRDYVRGWKARHYGGEAMPRPHSQAYRSGFTDRVFNPIEYVEDTASIYKYGVIQGGLDNNDEIFPTIQKRDLGNGLGRADEVVDVETILVDEPASNTEAVADIEPISEDIVVWYDSVPSNDTLNMTVATKVISISDIKDAHIVKDTDIEIVQHVRCVREFSKYDAVNNSWHTLSKKTIQKVNPLKINSMEVSYINNVTGKKVADITNIEKGTAFYIVVTANVSGFVKKQTNIPHLNPIFSAYTGTFTPDATFKIITSVNTEIDYTPIHGIILGNYTEGTNRISGSTTIPANGNGRVQLLTEIFEVDEDGTTNIDVPTRITSSDTTGSYSPRKIIDAINVDTNEAFDPSNLSEGKYRLRVITDITNLTAASQTYTVELLPTYIYYPYDSEKWRPTFDIWIKDIWGSTRLDDENDTSYAERVWQPILGDRQGDEAKVVFSSGSLSGYSDWEFPIVAYAFDNSKSLDGVHSHWRLTLAKSDAEVDASGKWIPSIQTQAHAGDYFYFIGIDMPHQYVLWAEEEVDKWKRENMPSNITPTWTISLDKVRINTQEYNDTALLFSQLNVGSIANFKGYRFTKDEVERRYIQSMSLTWNEGRVIPDVEVILSDKPLKHTDVVSDVKKIKTDITIYTGQITKGLSAAWSASFKAKAISDKASNEAKKASMEVSKTQKEVVQVGIKLGAVQADVTSLNYLKKVVKKSDAYEVDAASLDSLISVQDAETSALKAGLYGGGVKALDEVGALDTEHGHMVLFAGVKDETDLTKSRFKVYEDGTLHASHGIFGGLLKRSHTEVTPDNIGTYIIRTAMQGTYVDLTKVGSFVTFKDFVDVDSWIPTTNITTITLPYYMQGNNLLLGNTSLDNMLALVGNTIVVRFDNSDTATLCFNVPSIGDDGTVSKFCAVADILILTCVAKRDTKKKLNIAWKSL